MFETQKPAADGAEASDEVRIRVIIVDDHALMRSIMRKVLNRDADIEIVGSAADGREAVDLISEAVTDVVLLDLALPEMDGVEVLKHIRERSIKTPVIFVSVHSQAHAVLRALQEGAQGYVDKSSITRELVPAVHAVTEGGTYFSESLEPIARRGLES